MLHDLYYRGWTDEQGILASEANAFERDILPRLIAALDAWSGPDSQLQIQTVNDLIRDLHGAHLTPLVVAAPTSTGPPTVP